MAFRTRRFRRSRSRRGRSGRKRRYSGGGLTSQLARSRVMSNRPFGRSAGSMAPRKMYTKLENIHILWRSAGLLSAQYEKGAYALVLSCPWYPFYTGTANGFNPTGTARSASTDMFPLGWQNYYGLYKQFVVTGVKYSVTFLQDAPVAAAAGSEVLSPMCYCTILPVPQDPNTGTGSMFPSTGLAAQAAPNARTVMLRGTTPGSNSSQAVLKGYIPMSVLQGQDVYDDRFYQNTFPTTGTQSDAVSGAMSTLAIYTTNHSLGIAAGRTFQPPTVRVSLRWYITFFDVRMFSTTT